MKNVNLFLVSVITLVVIISSACGGGSSNSSSSSKSNDPNENVANKVSIVNTKLPTRRWDNGKVRDREFEVTIRNISNQDLGGKVVKFFVHYKDGEIVSTGHRLEEYFSPGDTRKIWLNVKGHTEYNMITKRNDIFIGDVPIKVELNTN